MTYTKIGRMGILNYIGSILGVSLIDNGLLHAAGRSSLNTQLDLALLLKSNEQMCGLVDSASN
jgi:hypothetical protein